MMMRLRRMVQGWGADPAAAHADARGLTLRQIPFSQPVELVSIDLPADELEPLLERGILPGCRLCPIRNSPSGDPIVAVDGSVIALRRETAACLCVRLIDTADA
jgi:Fe2+ transport system protein FeoA